MLLMEVMDAGNELGEELGGVPLLQVSVSQDVIEELSTWMKFSLQPFSLDWLLGSPPTHH